ncbi:MAG: DUF4919 domain-containing protein [Bacteroidales bacterium]|nr:DUF4919 domain-containing protein [Bacteroidales bacterium]
MKTKHTKQTLRSLLMLLSLMLTFSMVNAQEVKFERPDYASIKAEITDSTSAYFYPGLISRFESYDSTLTLQDYRHLYYGYIYHADYEPYRKSKHDNNLHNLLQSEKNAESDFNQIIESLTASIDEFPFDIRKMLLLINIYQQKGDKDMVRKEAARFYGIIGAIFSSGNGVICETGFHVISPGHEQIILNLCHLKFKSQSLIGDCDYLEVEENSHHIKGLYFNIREMFRQTEPSHSSPDNLQ